jgi:putative transposase
MIVRKGMKYRAYPTPEQEIFLPRISGCVRLVFNLGLEQREMFARPGRSIRYEGQRAELKELKAHADFLRDIPHHCLQEGLVDLQTAFERFFKGISGYPQPRLKGQDDGFRFPDPKQFYVATTDDAKFAMLHLPKMGKKNGDHGALRLRLHRPLEGKIRSLTLNHEAGIWHASFLCEIEVARPAQPFGEAVGVDRGVAVPIMVSDGTTPHVPLPTERQRIRERRLHKAISRRKRGSNNRRKAVRALGRHKAKEARRRRDALHKATTHLAKNHSLIVIEDLRVKNMTASAAGTIEEPGVNVAQKSGLNRAILSVGWGASAVMLGYKTIWYGSELRRVPPMGTSQECSECHQIDAPSRISRDVFRCTACGHTKHADLNASETILYRGLQLPTPKDTRSGSACGVLCAKQDREAGNESRKVGSPVIHDRE